MIISHENNASDCIAEQLLQRYSGEQILHKHAIVTQFQAQASEHEKRYFKFATFRNP